MKFLINLLFNIAAFFFNLALRLSRKFETLPYQGADPVLGDPEGSVIEADEPEGENLNDDLAVDSPQKAKAFFRSEDGAEIPLSMDPLPEFKIFAAMFERKYGRLGRMPITVGGTSRQYNVFELYTLLTQLSVEEKPSEMMKAIYGSVMSVVMRAHGEAPPNPRHLN